jgi:hypothetical protein
VKVTVRWPDVQRQSTVDERPPSSRKCLAGIPGRWVGRRGNVCRQPIVKEWSPSSRACHVDVTRSNARRRPAVEQRSLHSISVECLADSTGIIVIIISGIISIVVIVRWPDVQRQSTVEERSLHLMSLDCLANIAIFIMVNRWSNVQR